MAIEPSSAAAYVPRRGPKEYQPITIEALLERARTKDPRPLRVRDIAYLAGFSAAKVRQDIVVHRLLTAQEAPSGSRRGRRRFYIFRIRCGEAVRYLRTLGVID